jgi:hypothetical protein
MLAARHAGQRAVVATIAPAPCLAIIIFPRPVRRDVTAKAAAERPQVRLVLRSCGEQRSESSPVSFAAARYKDEKAVSDRG